MLLQYSLRWRSHVQTNRFDAPGIYQTYISQISVQNSSRLYQLTFFTLGYVLLRTYPTLKDIGCSQQMQRQWDCALERECLPFLHPFCLFDEARPKKSSLPQLIYILVIVSHTNVYHRYLRLTFDGSRICRVQPAMQKPSRIFVRNTLCYKIAFLCNLCEIPYLVL